MRIDSHQHFWHYNPLQHTWMTAGMDVLKKDFLPHDLAPLLEANSIAGTIAVQARQSREETDWLLALAGGNEFIKGVVGWVDLRSPKVHDELMLFSGNRKLVGVRHVVHDEADDDFMMQPAFVNGIASLEAFNLTYDLLLFPKHIPVALKLVELFPEQPFVVDHIAKPFIKNRVFSPWKEDLIELAKHPNVYCKLSGMVTEAVWKNWKAGDFDAYLDIVTEAFGTDRIMMGSDWPVCALSADYSSAVNVVINYVGQFPAATQEAILGCNCMKFYKLISGI
jgi:L-fuconolactonase